LPGLGSGDLDLSSVGAQEVRMPGVFSRGGGSRAAKPNPLAGRLAGVVPPLPAPGSQPPIEDDDTDQEPLDGLLDVAPVVVRPAPRSRPTGLAAAAPVQVGGPAVFSLRAGYNLPTPDPFARNRQRVGKGFGEVVVSEGIVLLQLRRKQVGRLLPPVRLRPEEIRLASPTQTDFMGNNKGVVFQRLDGEHLYVWVDEPTPLLTVLSIQGFAVGADPVPVTRAG
jgi:hypothetical protein